MASSTKAVAARPARFLSSAAEVLWLYPERVFTPSKAERFFVLVPSIDIKRGIAEPWSSAWLWWPKLTHVIQARRSPNCMFLGGAVRLAIRLWRELRE